MGLIVIGNGIAGGAVVKEIRKRAPDLEITVFGGEPHVNYNRILLSDVLAGAKTFDEIFLNVPQWYEENGIKLFSGEFITHIDIEKRAVISSQGHRFGYDILVMATGSLPSIPPVNGMDKKGVFTFRNIEDTQGMIQWAFHHNRAVVMGGGLLGLEAARGLTNRGMVVTIVHLMGHLMEQQLDRRAGDILLAEVEKMGIGVKLNCTVSDVLGKENVEAVRLTSDEIFDTDLVLVTAGIRPNANLAREAGFLVNRGIIVDDFLETNYPGVFAVGECIEHRGRTYGLVAPIMEQVKVVAEAIAGERKRIYDGSVSSATLKVAGLHLTSMGDIVGQEEGSEELVYMDAGSAIYKKLVVRNNRVVGAIFLGDEGGSGEIQEMIRTSRDISAERQRLLTGNRDSVGTIDPVSMPDAAVICNCQTVTKAEILFAIREKKCKTMDTIAECTGASTGCGSCIPLVERILDEMVEVVPGESGVVGNNRGRATSINRIEKLKNEKNGLDVLDDLYRYSKEGWEKITESDIQRLKWHGLFLRNSTPGHFMIRVRIPNGHANTSQFQVFSDISERFGKGYADITTRQQIQIQNIRIENVPEIFELLHSVGLTSLQTGMDNIRNVMGCAVSGLSQNGLLDATSIVNQFNNLFIGNRAYSNLPRKFNVAITGCRENCLPVESQDISMVPATKEIDGANVIGFNVLVGGKMGSGGFRSASPLDVFALSEEAVEILNQITLLYRDHGPRENRTKARLAFLLDDWGTPRFRKELEGRMGRFLYRSGKDERESKRKNDHIGVFRQKQSGLNYAGLLVPVGRISARQMREGARLSEKYGTGEIRLTSNQNLILPNIPDRTLGNFLQEPLLVELQYNPSEIMRGLVSCTGIEYCNLAVIETKKRALEIARKLDEEVPDLKPVEIHWSGCPAGCGNHLVSDIGLLGKRAKVTRADGSSEVVDAVDIFIGGRGGLKARGGTKVFEDIPCDQLPEVMKGLVRYVAREKGVEGMKSDSVSLASFANLNVFTPETK